MGLTAAGADRFLNAVIGQAVSAGSSMAGKLHTADPPLAGNELSGNGYTDHDLVNSDFAISTEGDYRRLTFPEQEFFADAGSQAQDAAAFGFWHGTSLIWSQAVTVDPQQARVSSPASYLEVLLSSTTLTITQAAIDRGLEAIAGQNYSAASMFWELHSGTGVPTSANRLTGGGIDGIAEVAWTLSTVSGYRRAAQAALDWGTLTADTNAEPTRLALWRGRPESSGVLHAYRAISPSNDTEDGATITLAANMLYLEILLAGTTP